MGTMNVRAGVNLTHKGFTKEGPRRDHIEGKMTRADYNSMAQREISGDTMLQFTQSGGVRAVGGNTGKLPAEATSPSNHKQSTDAADPTASSSTSPARNNSLP